MNEKEKVTNNVLTVGNQLCVSKSIRNIIGCLNLLKPLLNIALWTHRRDRICKRSTDLKTDNAVLWWASQLVSPTVLRTRAENENDRRCANSRGYLDLGVCCILSLTPPAIRECLCNGHKLLRRALEIDFCLRRDLLKKKKEENRWNGKKKKKTLATTQRGEKKGVQDEGVKVREEGKPNTSKEALVSSHRNALWIKARPVTALKTKLLSFFVCVLCVSTLVLSHGWTWKQERWHNCPLSIFHYFLLDTRTRSHMHTHAHIGTISVH